jgi:hypothetical protein
MIKYTDAAAVNPGYFKEKRYINKGNPIIPILKMISTTMSILSPS